MNLKTAGLFALATTVLSGCYENEKSCYERLSSDFERSSQFGSSNSCSRGGNAAGCRDYEAIAVQSKARILLIYLDDDQNACDYYSDGPILRRK